MLAFVLFGLILVLFFFTIIVIVVNIVLPVTAVLDILKSKFNQNYKAIWLIVVILTNFIGAILYFYFGKKQKIAD